MSRSSSTKSKKRSKSSDSTTAAPPSTLPELASAAPPPPSSPPPATSSLPLSKQAVPPPPVTPGRSLRAIPSRLARAQQQWSQLDDQKDEQADAANSDSGASSSPGSNSASLVSFGNLGVGSLSVGDAYEVTTAVSGMAAGAAVSTPVPASRGGRRRSSSRRAPLPHEEEEEEEEATAGVAPDSTKISYFPSASFGSSSSGVAAEIAAEKSLEQVTNSRGSRNSDATTDSGRISGSGSATAVAAAAAAAAGDDFDIPLEHLRMRDGSFESDVPVQAIAELFNCHFTIVSQVRRWCLCFGGKGTCARVSDRGLC